MLDRKLADKTKHEMICMLWKEFMSAEFYRHICQQKNFLYVNGKNVLQPKVLQIISEFIEPDENSYRLLQKQSFLLQNNFSVCLLKCISGNLLLR